ncbi:hypothetical protein SALBM311S_01302 [Streptomyces alboniger]
MRDEDHRRVVRAAPRVDQLGHGPLVVQVEGEQRLVAQQDAGVGGQCLPDAHALAFTAGQQAERDVGVGGGPDRLQDFVHPAAYGTRTQPESEAVPVDPEAHQVAGAQHRLRGERGLLRYVADVPARLARRAPQDGQRAGGQLQPAQQGLHEAGLARPVRPEDGDELARLYVEFEVLPDGARAVGQRGAAQSDHRGDAGVGTARPGPGVALAGLWYGGHVRPPHLSRASASASTLAVIQPR